MCKPKEPKKKLSYGDLAKDQRCIYQTVSSLEGSIPENDCKTALQGNDLGKAAEVDDEAAIVVLAKHYGYSGPSFATGANFNALKFTDGDKVLAICTGNRLKQVIVGATEAERAKLLMNPENTKGVTFHAIGITVNKGVRVIHDEQQIRKDGPFTKDDVIYWKK
jgi:hypothetical protein